MNVGDGRVSRLVSPDLVLTGRADPLEQVQLVANKLVVALRAAALADEASGQRIGALGAHVAHHIADLANLALSGRLSLSGASQVSKAAGQLLIGWQWLGHGHLETTSAVTG